MPVVMVLKVGDLTLDEALQARLCCNGDTEESYADDMEAGAKFPPGSAQTVEEARKISPEVAA